MQQCPKCGSDMVQKTARRGPNAGRPFLSCRRYPDYRETRNIDGSVGHARSTAEGQVRIGRPWQDPPGEVVQVLLDANADATATNEDGKTAWDVIQKNEALKETPAYWALNHLHFQ